MTAYESAAERDVLLELDFDREVLAVAAQPFVIRLASDREHRPDFAVSLRGRGVVIVEVKDDVEACAAHDAKPRTIALREALTALGWTYVTRAPTSIARRRNLRWLRGCRPQAHELEKLTAGMLAAAEDACTIADLVALAHPAISRPVLGRLLWDQQLRCHLDSVIGDHTIVRAIPAEELATRREEALGDRRSAAEESRR